ncbi:unnamed protein product [Rhizopus stolonifer]
MAEEVAHRDMPEATVPIAQPQMPMPQPGQSIYKNNIGVMEGLFNRLKAATGFGDPYVPYYSGNIYGQPNMSQIEEMMRQQQMASSSMPMSTAGMMVPMNYYQQQQQAQQLLDLFMMMSQQQQPYFQQQQMMQYQLMQQQAAMGASQKFNPYQPINAYHQQRQQMSYYPQQRPTYPYDDYSQNYSSYYDTRYINNGFYPLRTNRFSSIKDLRPY